MPQDTQLTSADTLAADVRARAARTAPRAVLVVYGEDATTRVVEVPDGGHLTIGRSRNATVHVESERVSRIHARVTRHGNVLAVEDAGSRNGTWVNGAAITGAQVLASGDEIVVGPATIVVGITSRVDDRPRIHGGGRLEERLAAEVDRGLRYHRVFGLLMVRVEGAAPEVEAAIDRLSSRLRPMDLAAEYAPNELAVVLPELDPAAAAETARALVAAARKRGTDDAPVSVVAGLAAFPGHGTTMGALISRARAAIASARGRTSGAIGTPPDEAPGGADVIVEDPQMQRVFELVHKVADHPITVLVCGETGAGKEVVAAAIHGASRRRAAPLVRVNCASLPEGLLESALFGHEKGAFTGADRRAQGFFEAAHGGTLFLDEIGEISAAMQAKLLRVLEQRRFTRVGGTDEIEVDVRVVCATNRDLEAETRRNAFRLDLFYRISAFTILVPPLRDRPGEILRLAELFIRQLVATRRPPALAPAAAAAVRRYPWPGNVRELRNAIERAVVVHTGDTIELEDLPDHVREAAAAHGDDGSTVDIRDHVASLERKAIDAALAACNGNQTEAARRLGISRRTLIYRMEKHGLKPPPASRAQE
ncbi:MAG TPA: sigma 54-interacting transcriptional regulator [Kofleriaceae bacterium]|nr:sigma 54-interacting transcriptional regulator [Kofleriaceae bacterium]